jgi:GNAT superfamily N-acetyltransferase
MKPASGTVRPARVDEAQLLSELAMRSKAHWGYDGSFMEQCRAELTVTAEAIAKGLTFVFEGNQAVLGLYTIEQLTSERMEISLLFVEPAFIGHGYGRALIQHAIDSAWSRGAATLEVQGDPNAVDFYQAMGGRQVALRPSASIAGRMLPVFEIDIDRHRSRT